MKISKATKKDFKGILNVFVASAKLNPKDKGNKELKKYILASLRSKTFFILVAKANNEVIGFSITNFSELKKMYADLVDIYVLKEYRGKGVGRGLMKELYKELKKKNIKNIGLYSENNEKTLNFYKKQGFQVGRLIRRCDKKIR